MAEIVNFLGSYLNTAVWALGSIGWCKVPRNVLSTEDCGQKTRFLLRHVCLDKDSGAYGPTKSLSDEYNVVH